MTTTTRETVAVPPSLVKAGRALTRARERQRQTLEAVRIEALDALAAGVSEVAVADAAGVDRMTVRKWQGKR